MNKKIGLGLIAILVILITGLAAACSTCLPHNTPPERPTVYISPSAPISSDTLYCYASSYDADGDTLTYHYSWYRNSSLFRTHSTKNTYHSISSSSTRESDTWKCVVRAFDGKEYSTSNSDQVRIGREHRCADIELSTSTTRINMESRDSTSVQFWVKNHGNAQECISLSAQTFSSRIDAKPSITSMCLHAGESRLVALVIDTKDASAGNYTVKMRAEGGCRAVEKQITVVIDRPCCDDGIELVPERTSICQGEKDSICVLVKNLTDRRITVRLESSSTSFITRFEKSEIILDPRQEKYVNLNVYADGRTGSHHVNIYARSGTMYTQAKAYFNIKDCPDMPTCGFLLEVPTTCASIEKSRERSIPFTVRNLTGSTRTINLQTVSTILSETEVSRVTLAPHEKKTIFVKVSARTHDEPGKHHVTVYAWDGACREKRDLCIEVNPLRRASVFIPDNDKEIEQCKFGLFVLNVENTGDVTEHFRININNPTQAKITVSDESFELRPKEGKEVFVTVNVPLEMPTGDYTADVVIENGKIWSKPIYFTVTKATDPKYPVDPIMPDPSKRPVIVSYPTSIAIQPGEERVLSFSLYNPTSTSINTSVELMLPPGFYSEHAGTNIAPGQTKELLIRIKAHEELEEDKYHYGKAVLRYNGFSAERELELYVQGIPAETAPIGFFGLDSSIIAGIIIFAAFIIILLIARASRQPKEKNVMLYRR